MIKPTKQNTTQWMDEECEDLLNHKYPVLDLLPVQDWVQVSEESAQVSLTVPEGYNDEEALPGSAS